MMRLLLAVLLTVPLLCGSVAAAVPGKIAVVQYRPAFGQTETNIDRLTAYADEAAKSGANLVLFPEGSILGYDNGDRSLVPARHVAASRPMTARFANAAM